MNLRQKISLGLLGSLLLQNVAAQNALPRLELGAGPLILNTPDYRGSRQTNTYLLPTPYIKYRGERLRVDDGAQGVIFDSDALLLTISANLSLPADQDTPERIGMDELEAILEIGPSLNYRLLDLAGSAWWLDIPLRYAYTLDGDFDSVGWVLQPRLSWRKPSRVLGEWKLRFNFGPLYSSDAHHAYFYSVASEEALASRPAYTAEGGFSGVRVEFTYSKRIGQYWLGGFVRYDNLRDSKIEDSPLVSDSESWMGGLALAWVFHQE